MAYTAVKISANSSDYQSQMKAAAAQMKVLSSEYSVAATKAKLFGNETESLKAKAESLTQKITVQKDIIKLNEEQQGKLTSKLTEQTGKQEELKKKIDDAKTAYQKSTEETGKNSEQSKALKQELEKLEQEFKTNEAAIGKTETALANQTKKTNTAKVKLMEMESELEKVNKELKNHKFEAFTKGLDKAGDKIEGFGKKMSVVSVGVAGVATASIAAFNEIDEGYDTIVTKTGATGDALDGLTQSADNVFSSMPEDMALVGEAIGEVNTRFHLTDEELENLSTQFIQFAEINETNVTQSVDQIDKIMKAWNIDSSQTGNLLGLLTSKAQETGISVDKLEGFVLDNNAAFKEMHLSLPQAINLMAQFDANGVDTTTALAGLKKALQNATAEGKSMDVALRETIDKIKNAKSETQALQIATDLFGKKGAAEMTKAIRENRIDLTSLSKSMSEYGKVVEDTYNGTLDPIDNSKVAMNNAKLALSELATTAQTSASPMIENVTKKIQELTKRFTSLSPAQQETIMKAGLVTASIGPLAIGFGKVTQGISSTIKTGKDFVSGVAGIIAKITAKTAATTAGAAADAGATAAEAAHATATVAATATTGGMTAAQTALNVAMNLCPIILIVTLIGGLIAAGVALYKNWDTVKEKLTALWGNIKEKFDKIKNAVSGAFLSAKQSATEKMKEIEDKIVNSKVGQAASKVFGAMTGTVKEKLGNMKTAYEENGGGIKGVVSASWEGVKGYYTAGLTFVDKLTDGKLSDIKDKFKGKLTEIKTNVSEDFENMKTTVNAKMTEWKTNASNKLMEMKTEFSSKVSDIKSDWSAKFSNVKDTATNMMEMAKNNVKTKLTHMKTAYEENGGGIKGVVSAHFTGVRDTIGSLMNAADKLTGGKLSNIKSAFSLHLGEAKSKVSSIMDGIKSAFSSKIEDAKNAVSNGIKKIKAFFNFSWSLPSLKLPHFSLSGEFSLSPPSVPSFSVSWYKTGAIMTEPIIFGMNGNELLAGGEPETGGEAILPLAPFYNRLSSILDSKFEAINRATNVYVYVTNELDGEEISSKSVDKVIEKITEKEKEKRMVRGE